MAKRLTPAEQKAHDLVKRLNAVFARGIYTDADMARMMDPGGNLKRETVNRWRNWRMPPRGLSLTAIEKFLELVEG
jgi:hypothetical protein